jgi:adenylate kinase family enzyme
MPFATLSRLCSSYWAESDFDEAERARWREEDRWGGVYRYEMPFHAAALERALHEHSRAVLALDAVQSVYDSEDLLDRVQLLFKPLANVFLLQPSPNLEKSLEILSRLPELDYRAGMKFWDYVVKHPANFRLSRHIVFNEERTSAETCEEILRLIDPSQSVVLIGPPGAGKSTQSRLLAERLNKPCVSLDVLGWDYAKEAGWSELYAHEILERDGSDALWRWEQEVNLHVIRRVRNDFPNAVIAFGMHALFDENDPLQQAQQLLSSTPNIVLLLPYPDLDASVKALEERTPPMLNGMPMDRFLLSHPSNGLLATHTFYTDGKTAKALADEIVHVLIDPPASA